MKTKQLTRWALVCLVAFFSILVNAQVRISDDGVITDPDPSAILDIKTSLGKGLLLPRVANTSAVAAASLKAGMMVFSIADDCVMYYNGTKWMSLCECASAPDAPGTISFSTTTINQGGTFTASVAEVSGAVYYTWTLPNGLTGTSTTRSITITGTTAGSYAASGITVKANNACGTSTATAGAGTITVRNCTGAPAAPGTISLSTTTVNLNGTFTASVTAVSGATSYTWTLPSGLSGSSTTNSITLTTTTAGSIAASGITVKANNDCGTSTAKSGTGTITVNDCSEAPSQPGAITFSATTVNLNGTFTASVAAVTGATSYTWTLPSGLSGSSTTRTITITGITAGSIAATGIKVKANNACGTSSARSGSGTITVNSCSAAPATPGTISLSATTVNLNGTLTASVTAVSGATSYVWTLPSGLTGSSTTNSITLTATNAGSISASSITVKAVNDCGTSTAKSGTGTITVRNCSGAPSTLGTISLSATTVNLNGTLTASVTAVSGATSYTWTLPSGLSGTSTTNSITLTATAAGSIAASGITVKANNDCGSSAVTVGTGIITVRNCSGAPSTPGTISLSATTVNLNGTLTASVTAVSGATSYTWTLPSGLSGSSIGTSITITGSSIGSYSASNIYVVANNECGSSVARYGSGTITVTAACGSNGTAVSQRIGNNYYLTHTYGNRCWMVQDSKEGTSSVHGFYTKNQANQTNNACPNGWRLPTKSEVAAMFVDVKGDPDGVGKWWTQKAYAFPPYCCDGVLSTDYNNNNRGIWWQSSIGSTYGTYTIRWDPVILIKQLYYRNDIDHGVCAEPDWEQLPVRCVLN